MKSRPAKNTPLHRELRSAGAQEAELPELAAIATHLRGLPSPKMQLGRHWAVFRSVVLASVAGLVIGILLISYAQTSLPGSHLYALKKASEAVAVTVDPNYRATIMMRRAQEVQALVGNHANTDVVLGTLADYRSAAVAYMAKAQNYAVFDACKASLRHAEAEAAGSERQAIRQTLESLNNG